MPEVSLHTAVKGQFGLGTGRAPGKALKKAMFLRRPHQKRKLLLQIVPATPQAPAMTFRAPTIQGGVRDQQWFEACVRSHAAFCGCGDPVLHFNNIATRFHYLPATSSPLDPTGGAPPRRPQLRRLAALPAAPPSTPESQPWRGGGGDDGAGGPDAAGGPVADAEYGPEDLDDLFAAIEADTQ